MRQILSLSIIISTLSCAGLPEENASEQGDVGHVTLTQLQGVASIEDCPNGGKALEHGVDNNGNGILDPDEVQKTYILCHGAKGDKGDPGEKGPKGLDGAKGDKGDQGEKGLDGAKGDKGDQGDQGDIGNKGDIGNAGDVGISWVSPAKCSVDDYKCSPKDCQDTCTAANAVIPTKADLWKLAVAGKDVCEWLWFIDTSTEEICIGLPAYNKDVCPQDVPTHAKPRIVVNDVCKNLSDDQTWDSNYATNTNNTGHTANCACIKMDGVHQQP